MSVTILINGQTATLADGEWRSASVTLREHLNTHLESVQLEIPAHHPPRERELQAARLAAETYNGKIIDSQWRQTDPARASDGSLTVF